ncbi:GNAT family N-acetyltransferase [Microbacterium awajiense]|uniref:GNAT family N-acetyltransferase n=1 Tax=Microbacterium awajiense TaxID=415214 RepID=A0ABP7AGS7_9MICO
MIPVILRTKRLELSVPGTDDVDAIFAACQDPEIQRYTTVPSPYQRAHAEEFIRRAAAHWEEGTEVVWALRADGVLAGVASVFGLTEKAPVGEIGYWMAPGMRGRGLLGEAITAVVTYALSRDGLGLRRLQWRAIAGNRASASVAARAGFRFEGTLRAALPDRGTQRDGWVAAILDDDDRMPQDWPVLAG